MNGLVPRHSHAPKGAPCSTERGSHAHDGYGQLPRPPAGNVGAHGAAQVSIGHMQAWGSMPVGVSREGARAKHAEAGGACGLGRLRPVRVLGMVRVRALGNARSVTADGGALSPVGQLEYEL